MCRSRHDRDDRGDRGPGPPLRARLARAIRLPRSRREGQEVQSGRSPAALGLALLLRLELLAEYRRDLTLHERPRDRRVRQRALLPARTVHLEPTETVNIP